MQRCLVRAMLTITVIAGRALCGDEPTPGAAPVSEVPPCPVPLEPGCRDGLNCGPPSCFWVSAETLLWWTKGSQFPALITTGVPGPLPGVLGQPGTAVLFGGADFDRDDPFRVGGRFSAGLWLNSCRSIGIDASYFFVAPDSQHFDSDSALIARPFFDVLSGTQNAQLVAFPGVATGQIHLDTYSRFQGGDINLFCNLCCSPRCEPACNSGDAANCCPQQGGCNYSVVLLGGFRYLSLEEGLGITETSQVSTALPAGTPTFGGSSISIGDRFDTSNSFYGAQIGARAEACWGMAFVNVVGKVALGVTQETADIHGSTAITSPAGVTTVTPVGFLASGSNSGHFTRDQFAVVPEVGINFGCQITRNLRASIGYSFLYWSQVVRPANQIDTGLSGTEIPTDSRYNPAAGPARPAILLRETDFWAQGVNLGLELRY